MSPHVHDELAALLAGELSRSETQSALDHLASCEACRAQLLHQIAVAAALRSASRHAPELFATAEGAEGAPGSHPAPENETGEALPRPAPPSRRPRWARGAVAVLAAAALIAGSVIAGMHLRHNGAAQAEVVLHVVGANAGSGHVVMRPRGTTTDMLVSTRGLARLGAGEFYEVWLFAPSSGKMLAVGVLPPNGQGAYLLSPRLLSQYQAVDISRQQDNGNPAHSSDSVLRARYA